MSVTGFSKLVTLGKVAERTMYLVVVYVENSVYVKTIQKYFVFICKMELEIITKGFSTHMSV